MKYNLTDEEANFIKDILQVTSARALGMKHEEFNEIADTIFIKLGNGRLTEEKNLVS